MQESGEVAGFQCPACGKFCLTICIDSRFSNFGKRRRRECEFCHARFNTVEVLGDARIAEQIVSATRKKCGR